MIKLFCKRNNKHMFNGKPLYHGFPRPLNGKHDSAKKWINWGKPSEIKEFTVENKFTAYIFDSVSVRGMSSKIPQVALYLKDEDVYVRVDFRLDGLIGILCNHTVSKGKISVSVGLRFSGSNYYVEEIAKVPQLSGAGKAIKKKPKIKPVIGQYYNLDANNISPFKQQYLGTFTVAEGINFDPYGDISGKKYHVFVTMLRTHTVVDCFRSIPVNIREQDEGIENDFTKHTTITTEYGSLGQYYFGNNVAITLDIHNKLLSFTDSNTINNDMFTCDANNSTFTDIMKKYL